MEIDSTSAILCGGTCRISRGRLCSDELSYFPSSLLLASEDKRCRVDPFIHLSLLRRVHAAFMLIYTLFSCGVSFKMSLTLGGWANLFVLHFILSPFWASLAALTIFGPGNDHMIKRSRSGPLNKTSADLRQRSSSC